MILHLWSLFVKYKIEIAQKVKPLCASLLGLGANPPSKVWQLNVYSTTPYNKFKLFKLIIFIIITVAYVDHKSNSYNHPEENEPFYYLSLNKYLIIYSSLKCFL